MDYRMQPRRKYEEEDEEDANKIQITEISENVYSVTGTINKIPTEVYALKLEHVTELILNYNDIESIDEEFCTRMKVLRKLHILGNKLISLPNSIDCLHNVEELHLNENSIINLPETFVSLSAIKILNLQGNKLTELPINFGNLVNLEILKLDENCLETLPDTFSNLINLKELDLSSNKIISLPQNFGNMSSLLILNCSTNQLKELPEGFGKLANITNIDLSQNHLTSFPGEFASAEKLKSFYADDNEVVFLPPWFGQLKNIEELSMKCNYLRGVQFPKSFGNLSSNLIHFDMSGNLLEELPESFSKCRELKFIDLGSPLFEPERKKELRNGNNISYLPKNFGVNFYNLDILRLDECGLCELPNNFGEGLTQVTVLNLYMNHLETIPESICVMKKLKILTLSHNYLKILPTEFGNLSYLEELFLDVNQLSYLPRTFEELVNLKILDLYGNKFETFPSILRELPLLDCLGVGLNISSMFIDIKKELTITQLHRLVLATGKGEEVWQRKDQLNGFKNLFRKISKPVKTDLIVAPSGNARSPGLNGVIANNWDDNDENWDNMDSEDFDPSCQSVKPKVIATPKFPTQEFFNSLTRHFTGFCPGDSHVDRIHHKRKKIGESVAGQFDNVD